MEKEPAHKTERHPKHNIILNAKNALAILAAACFAASLFIDDSRFIFKAIAYGIGALAYLGELVLLTGAFKHRCDSRELLMPVLFGIMYILLGLNYAVEHYHIFGG